MVNVGALRTTISLDSAQFQQSMAGVNRQLQSLKQEQKAVTSSGTGFARGVDELRQKQDVLNRTLELQRGKVKELARQYDDTKKKTGENSKETQNAQTQYNKAVAEMNRTESALQGITEELNRQTNPWNRLSENMTNAGQKMQDVGRKMTSFGKSWSMKVTAPIVGMGALVLRTGMDFEAAMSNVQAVSGATGDDLALLESAAREMGATTTKSASDAADGLGYMALAGWETQEMLDGLEPILRLSEAGNMDLARASDLVTDSMSALGVEVKDLPAYLDNVAEASRSSNTSIDQLMQAYVTAGGNLNQFNIPLEESTALLGVMANNGIKGSEAGRGLNAMLINLTSGAGRAGTAMEELNISAFDSEGQFIGLEKTLRLVNEATKDMTDEQRAQYVSMIAGKEHMKTFQALMSELDDGYVSLKDNVSDAEGALNDMADTMQDNAKGNSAQLRSATEELSLQFSEHLIPVFVDVIGLATNLVQRFGELDSDTQKNIITMAGLAAAVGPAAIVMGNLTTAIGGVVKIGGEMSGMLGKVGGTALLGKIGALGLTGPVGLAVAGVGALGVGIYALTRDTSDNIEETYKSIQSRREEIDALDDTIAAYEQLQNKNKLSTDEVLRYMDIMSELEKAESEETIKRLKEEQEQLLKASGMTNEEMEEFLRLNGELVEKSPYTVDAISKQGNAYISVIDNLKELNQIERQRVTDDTYRAIKDELSDQEKNLERQKQLQDDIKNLEDDRLGLNERILDWGQQIQNIDADIAQLQQDKIGATFDELKLINEREELLRIERTGLENQIQLDDERVMKINKQIEGKQESLEKTNKELEYFDMLLEDYAQMVLYEQGIVSEKGRYNEALEKEQKLIDENREGLKRLKDEGVLVGGAYDEQNEKLNEQQSKLDEAVGKLEHMNNVAGETVYKGVMIQTNQSLSSFEESWSRTIDKRINISGRINGHAAVGYATGTDYHPGGEFLAGEEGWELGRQGNRWEMLDFGMYNRPAGYQVFTHDESKRILGALNNIPGYATGARPTGEVDRVVNRLNDYQEPSSQPVVIELHVTSEIDGRVAGQAVERYVTEIQDRNKKVREQFA